MCVYSVSIDIYEVYIYDVYRVLADWILIRVLVFDWFIHVTLRSSGKFCLFFSLLSVSLVIRKRFTCIGYCFQLIYLLLFTLFCALFFVVCCFKKCYILFKYFSVFSFQFSQFSFAVSLHDTFPLLFSPLNALATVWFLVSVLFAHIT